MCILRGLAGESTRQGKENYNHQVSHEHTTLSQQTTHILLNSNLFIYSLLWCLLFASRCLSFQHPHLCHAPDVVGACSVGLGCQVPTAFCVRGWVN